MVKLSVSTAAKILSISRFEIQDQINTGKLQTHEGYVTTDSLRLAYPNINFHSEQDKLIEKMQQIKNKSMFKSAAIDIAQSEATKSFKTIIAGLKTKLYKEKIKRHHYEIVFKELSERLDLLEEHCHSKDRERLHKLKSWVGDQH